MKNEERTERADTGVLNANRRAVLGASATGAAALVLGAKLGAAQPEAGAPRAAPNQPRLTERDVSFRSGDDEIRAFWAEPVPRPTAAIIVLHEIWGLNAHIRDMARRFAGQGYITLAPDLYSRQGAPNLDLNDRPALMAFLASLSDPQILGDLEAAITYLKEQGIEKVGCVGFCMGGLYSYLLACKSDNLDAAVDFYGRIVYPETSANKPESPLDLAPQLKCPLLCHFGETDASIPLADVEKLRVALQASTQPWKVNIYPGAGHAFFNDTRPAYNAAAAGDAGSDSLSFFREHLQN